MNAQLLGLHPLTVVGSTGITQMTTDRVTHTFTNVDSILKLLLKETDGN